MASNSATYGAGDSERLKNANASLRRVVKQASNMSLEFFDCAQKSQVGCHTILLPSNFIFLTRPFNYIG